MNKIKFIIIAVCFPVYIYAQSYEQLLKETSVEQGKITNTFLGTRLVNGQSTELARPGELNLMINHRFGELKGGLYEFWGLDEAEIRLGLDYGINPFLSVGFGRSSYQKTYDLSLKAKLLNQTDNGVPVTVTGFFSNYYHTLKRVYPAEHDNLWDRQSFLSQLLIAHKLSNIASFLITVGWLHQNYNPSSPGVNEYYTYGAGGRLRILKRVHINAEYYYIASKQSQLINPISIGFDLDTGGHLFQLIFSNTQMPAEKSLITDTKGSLNKGEIYFGFNLIRVFYLK